MLSGVRFHGAIGNTTIREANLHTTHTAMAAALPRHSAKGQGVAARSEPPPPLTWMILFFFLCPARHFAALLAGFCTRSPRQTIRRARDVHHTAPLSLTRLPAHKTEARGRPPWFPTRVCVCRAQGLFASRGRISFGRLAREKRTN